jgi:chromosome segregation ATPase
MVKKRLSDLLQEEAQKSSPLASDPAIEVKATSVSSTSEEETEKNVNLDNKEVDSSLQEESMPDVEQTNSRRTQPTKAELEATIKELKETLEQARENETSLGQQIVDLQSALSEQIELTERLKKELYEAKQAAIHLAEANTKLTEEIKALTSEKPNPNPNPKPVIAKKSYRTVANIPVRPSDEQIQTPNQMWLLD